MTGHLNILALIPAGVEITRGNYHQIIYFFGLHLTTGTSINYFNHTKNGGYYIGGFMGYEWLEGDFALGFSTGYKFVSRSGIYLRTGVIGLAYPASEFPFRPDIMLGFRF